MRMRFTSIALLIFISLFFSCKKKEEATPVPEPAAAIEWTQVSRLSFNVVASSANTIFARISGDSLVYASDDYGANWHAAMEGLKHNANIYTCTSADTNVVLGLASGTDEILYLWKRNKWVEILRTTKRSDQVWGLAQSVAVEKKTIYACSPDGVTHYSDNLGSTWKSSPSSSSIFTYALRDAFGANNSSLFAGPLFPTSYPLCCAYGGGLYRSVDMGTSWTKCLKGLRDTCMIRQIVCLGTKVYVYSEPSFSQDAPGWRVSADNGVTFSLASGWEGISMSWYNAGSLITTSENKVFAVNNGGKNISVSADGGNSWTGINVDLVDGEHAIQSLVACGKKLVAVNDLGIYTWDIK